MEIIDEGTSWHSYPSIFNIGHRVLAEFVTLPVQVEEKVDGSQFSFGRFNGELKVRSKGKQMQPDAPEKMFVAGVEAVAQLDLHDGWTYRGEYLQKPKHNALVYDRVPAGHVIIFDINRGEEDYLTYEEKAAEAARLGLEVVPLLYTGVITNEILMELLETTSVLGGQKIEGVVLKNYSIFGPDKKVLMGKYVSERFKEVHRKAWGESNPKQGDIIQRLVTGLRTEARWDKAVMHLREAGELEDDPRDIGKLLKAVGQDVAKEEADTIKEELFKWAWPQIQRALTSGLPDWYKRKLVDTQLPTREDKPMCGDPDLDS